ncbi:hypothetical protein BUALT_Bualt06G0049900 [Buddleja alternifolia]|uniref:Uncharacterized protein n=1 Tax=Buddleja alternifolia TaxID=168488 RepID=A0AAV6XE90_9LAMI|nr:hypothetical protein BUALT_Bualt06G0049900 [Buddleja alternifolia]
MNGTDFRIKKQWEENKNWHQRIPKTIVAQGVVVDLISGEKKDGHAFVKVYVEIALIPNEKLLRPHEVARTIRKAIHKCIHWEYVDVMEI